MFGVMTMVDLHPLVDELPEASREPVGTPFWQCSCGAIFELGLGDQKTVQGDLLIGLGAYALVVAHTSDRERA
jgi:hypothetical protein